MEAKGEAVPKVDPTYAGASAPAAITAWFHARRRYGHEFVCPYEQARDIARRTRTLVLSTAIPGRHEQGTIHACHAAPLV